MSPSLSLITRLMIVGVLLTHRCCSSLRSMNYPGDFEQAVDHAPKEVDNVLWILGGGAQPVSRLQSLLERIFYTRGKITTRVQREQLSSDSYNKRASSTSVSGLHSRGSGNYLEEKSAIRPQDSSPVTFSKRGIGLISLAVALAQNNGSLTKTRMQPVDLSAYPRRARFFIATMG